MKKLIMFSGLIIGATLSISYFNISLYAQSTYCAAEGGYVTIGNRQVFVCPYQGGTDACLYLCKEKEE